MEILWEEEGFQFGFKRWQGWAVSKVLWEWIPNVGSKARESAEAMSQAFVLLACPFVSRVISFIYDVRVKGMFNEPAYSFFVSVCCLAILSLLKWVVSCTWITCIQLLSRCSLTCLASSFFSESVVVFFSFPLLFHHAFFLVSGVLATSTSCTRLLACLIRASILQFTFRFISLLPLFFSRWKPG